MAKKEIQKRKRTNNYCRNKGSNYERQIVKELNELGFNTGTTRNNSKQQDNNKIDIYDHDGTLPCKIQLKKTLATPSYFKIRSESTVNPEEFVLFWAKQEKRETNFRTIGEAVILDKSFFYTLLKLYLTHGDSNCNV